MHRKFLCIIHCHRWKLPDCILDIYCVLCVLTYLEIGPYLNSPFNHHTLAIPTVSSSAWQMSLEQYRRAVSVPPVGQGIVYTNGASYCSPVGTVQTTTTYRPGSTTVISNGGGYYGGGYPGHVIAAPGQSVVVPGAAGTSYGKYQLGKYAIKIHGSLNKISTVSHLTCFLSIFFKENLVI